MTNEEKERGKRLLQQIIEESKENRAKLDSCDKHDFSIPIKEPKQYGSYIRRYQCSKCGGTLATSEVHWYKQGLLNGNKEG